jgi:hypothetical protein
LKIRKEMKEYLISSHEWRLTYVDRDLSTNSSGTKATNINEEKP